MAALGPGFDLHSGGVDLMFPHHENEIAQSEAATGQTFVRHWFHVKHLLVEGRKMSKSRGNLFTIDDVQARGFSAAELRFVLLSGHYRKDLNFVWENLAGARKALNRLADLEARLGKVDVLPPLTPESWASFYPVFEALLNDLNTPQAIAALFRRVKQLETGAPAHPLDAQGLQACLSTLGISLAPPRTQEAPQEVEQWAMARYEAKKLQHWNQADALREKIQEAGRFVTDLPQGYELTARSGS
jgi:cysteinyl-tRNA synthetase